MNMQGRFLLCCFLCGLLLIGDGRRHAGAVVIPIAAGIAAGAVIAAYAGINFYNSGAGAAFMVAANVVKNYVADFQGNMIDAVFTASASSVASAVNSGGPSLYPNLLASSPVPSFNVNSTYQVPVPTNVTLDGIPYSAGALYPFSITGCTTFTSSDYYRFVGTPPGAVDLQKLCVSSPYGGYFRPYRPYSSGAAPTATVDAAAIAAAISTPAKNAEISRALDQLFQSGNQNHSEIPTNGITLADGRVITMPDLLDTNNFKKSQEELAALLAKREAFDQAASVTLAASQSAVLEKQEADTRLAAATVARDAAVADALANPTDATKAAAAEKYIQSWEAAKTTQAVTTQTAAQAEAAAVSAAANAASVAATAAIAAAEDAKLAATPDPILPPPAFYDPYIEAPEKKDIPTLLQSFVANSPLSGALQAVVVSTSNANSVVLVQGKIFGQDMTFDFSRFDSSFRAVGAFAVLIYQGMAILFVIRGDNVVRGGSK